MEKIIYAMQPEIVISNEKISETAAVLKFKKTYSFNAGQVIGLSTSKDIPPRLYSICSAEQDEEISILYKIIPKGMLTPKLNQLNRGDEILISKPTGNFISNINPAYFIATGTGIAPFISMIKSGFGQNKTLIHGSRNFTDLYFYDELKLKLHSNYIPCCTNYSDNELFHGRITKYIREKSDLLIRNKYYLCGSAEMVVETRDILISKGILFQNIISEIYF